MNRGKEPSISLCERKFLLDAIKENRRLDGREVYDYRNIDINLGTSPGHVEVRLGDTRVFACVSCNVIKPRPQRPTEGQLFFNVELSPMASPAFDVGRPSSSSTEINRTLERCVKESRAVDTESLCIIAGEKVWEVRVDVHVLDHCGNMIDCAAIAALTALKHFRRPDVTVIGAEATIHSVLEREPVPLSVHHMPLCFTFAFFHGGNYLLVDPTLSEESVMEGRLVIGMNIHKEICALQMTGGVAIEREQVIRCSQIAAVKCIEITRAINSALTGTDPQSENSTSILYTKKMGEVLTVTMKTIESEAENEKEEAIEGDPVQRPQVTYLDKGTAELGLGGPNTWDLVHTASSNWSSSEDEVAAISREQSAPAIVEKDNDDKIPSKKKSSSNRIGKKSVSEEKGSEVIHISSGSEEEETTVLTNKDIGGVVNPNKQNIKLVKRDPVDEQSKGSKKNGKGGAMKKSKTDLVRSSPSEPPVANQPTTRTSRRKRQKK